MAYNFDKKSCDICQVTEEELQKKVDCAMTYAERMTKGSLTLGLDGSVLCPACQKENLLKKIFEKSVDKPFSL